MLENIIIVGGTEEKYDFHKVLTPTGETQEECIKEVAINFR